MSIIYPFLNIGLVVEAVTADAGVDLHHTVRCQGADRALKVLLGGGVEAVVEDQGLAPDQSKNATICTNIDVSPQWLFAK